MRGVGGSHLLLFGEISMGELQRQQQGGVGRVGVGGGHEYSWHNEDEIITNQSSSGSVSVLR